MLKDAGYYLNQVEATLAELEARSKDMKVGDAGVQIQDVDNLISNKDPKQELDVPYKLHAAKVK